MREEIKFKTIRSIVRKEINKKRASEILYCLMRNINLLIKKYLEHGRIAFIHNNSGWIPVKTFSREFEDKVIELYKKILWFQLRPFLWQIERRRRNRSFL